MITCHYCITFYSSKTRHRVGEGKTRIVFRYCSRIDKDVTTEEKSCNDFSSGPYFWCDEYSCWMTRDQCSSRRYNGECDCLQGKVISEIYHFQKVKKAMANFRRR